MRIIVQNYYLDSWFSRIIFFLTLLLVLVSIHEIINSAAESIVLKIYSLKIVNSLCLSFAAITCINQAYRSESSNERLFWLWFSILFFLCLVNNLRYITNLVVVPDSSSDFFVNDFTVFIFYLLILIGIEIRPENNKSTLNFLTFSDLNKLSGVITLIGCFTYFYLIPEQSHLAGSQTGSGVRHFASVMNFYLVIRVGVLVLFTDSSLWVMRYSLILASCLAWTLVELAPLLNFSSGVLIFLVIVQLLSVVVSARCISLKRFYNPSHHALVKRVYIDNFVALAIALPLVHFVGYSLQQFEPMTRGTREGFIIFWVVFLLVLYFVRRNSTFVAEREANQNPLNESQSSPPNIQAEGDGKGDDQFSALNIIKSSVIGLSNEGVITYCNRAASKLFGYASANIIGSSLLKLIPDADELLPLFKYISFQQMLDQSQNGLLKEVIGVAEGGKKIYLYLSLNKADYSSDFVYVAVLLDMSERRQLEVQKESLKKKFIEDLIHEFKTPLTIINSVVESEMLREKSARSFNDLSVAKNSGKRLSSLFSQLLELSRAATTNKLKFPVKPLNISRLTSSIVESFVVLGQKNSIKLEFSVDKDIITPINESALDKIIFNLMSNAYKYNIDGGTVTFTLERIGQDRALLAIANTGPNISASQQKRIFERFYRADENDLTKIEGVGIGLSLVMELVSAHGWTLDFHNLPDQGVKFEIEIFPILSYDELSAENGVEPAEVHFSDTFNLGDEIENECIVNLTKADCSALVIEDNSEMRELLKNMLDPHVECFVSGSGEEGLLIAEESLPDVIVCDLLLPVMDGFEVLRKIKSNEITAHIPIIILTGCSDVASRLKGLELSADDYLTKPFHARELLARIGSLIENRKKLHSLYLSRQSGSCLAPADDLLAPESSRKFINRMRQCIDLNYSDSEFSVSTLAQKLSISERQLQRKLKALTGLTPNEYLKEYRLSASKELLEKDVQVGEVAQAVGFSSQAYYGSCFKEKYGVSPKKFHLKHKAKS